MYKIQPKENLELIKKLCVYKKIKIPDESRHFIISDVHGKKTELDELIKEVGGTENDYYTFVGDVIDRGKFNSALLFDIIHKPNYNMVIGNHECFMIGACYDEYYFADWTYSDDEVDNGGTATFNQLFYTGMNFFSPKIVDKCPIILEIEHRGKTFGIVHAEIPYFYNMNKLHDWSKIIKKAKLDPEYAWFMLWGRQSIINALELSGYGIFQKTVKNNKDYAVDLPTYSGIDYVIHGHTGVNSPLIYKNSLWIDTGFLKGQICMAEYNPNNNQSFDFHFLDEETCYLINQRKDLKIS